MSYDITIGFETEREVIIAAWSAAIALSIGMWVGLWTVPAKALAVPTTAGEYGVSVAYRPLTLTYVVVPLLALGAAWYVTRGVQEDDVDVVEEPGAAAADGGQIEKKSN